MLLNAIAVTGWETCRDTFTINTGKVSDFHWCGIFLYICEIRVCFTSAKFNFFFRGLNIFLISSNSKSENVNVPNNKVFQKAEAKIVS